MHVEKRTQFDSIAYEQLVCPRKGSFIPKRSISSVMEILKSAPEEQEGLRLVSQEPSKVVDDRLGEIWEVKFQAEGTYGPGVFEDIRYYDINGRLVMSYSATPHYSESNWVTEKTLYKYGKDGVRTNETILVTNVLASESDNRVVRVEIRIY